MNILEANTDIVQKIREKFLLDKPGGKSIDPRIFKGYYVIYIIENLLTGKKYVGQTKNFHNRVNHYIWAYRAYTEGIGHINESRGIINSIVSDGIENFVMYPIDIAKTAEELSEKEKFYISYMNLTDDNFGYNGNPGSDKPISSKAGRVGAPHSISTKILKAKFVAAVNPDTKEMYVSAGMKLFGDLVGSHKDQVKNCTRRGIRHHGFYLVYLGKNDREDIKAKILKQQKEYDAHIKHLHEIHAIGGYSKANYAVYLSIVTTVEDMIDNRNCDAFEELGYNCQFLTYNTEEPYEPTWVKLPIEDFFSLISPKE